MSTAAECEAPLQHTTTAAVPPSPLLAPLTAVHCITAAPVTACHHHCSTTTGTTAVHCITAAPVTAAVPLSPPLQHQYRHNRGALYTAAPLSPPPWYTELTITVTITVTTTTADGIVAGLSFGKKEHKMGWNSQPTRAVILEVTLTLTLTILEVHLAATEYWCTLLPLSTDVVMWLTGMGVGCR